MFPEIKFISIFDYFSVVNSLYIALDKMSNNSLKF